MATQESCSIYYLSGSFIIFDPGHVLELRQKKIVSQPVGGGTTLCPPLRGPFHLSSYAVYVVAKYELAKFKKLVQKVDISIEANKSEFATKVNKIIDKEAEIFGEQRLKELEKRNITPSPTTLKCFDKSKLRLPIENLPEKKYSSYDELILSTREVMSIINNELDTNVRKMLIYKDLYDRGFYVSSGMKFGGDFLAYIGDPVLYHAQFAIRLVHSTLDGYVDLSKVDYNDLNAFQRLTHTAHKIPLFAIVLGETGVDFSEQSIDNLSDITIKYWTLRERQYLNPDSKNTDFESIDPDPKRTNKIRRLV